MDRVNAGTTALFVNGRLIDISAHAIGEGKIPGHSAAVLVIMSSTLGIALMFSYDEALQYLASLPDNDYVDVIIHVESRRQQRVTEAFSSELPESPDRNTVAGWLAAQHLAVDPGIAEIYYLQDAPDDELRFIEINRLLPVPEPLGGQFNFVDFGLDIDQVDLSLSVIDMTGDQWRKVLGGVLSLPNGWTIEPYRIFRREA